MPWTFTTSEGILIKAGENNSVRSSSISSGILLQFSNEAEAIINAETRKDWIAEYGNIGANFKDALGIAASSLAGNMVIIYNMSGYTSRAEAQTMLDVNRDNYRIAVAVLKGSKTKETMGVGG